MTINGFILRLGQVFELLTIKAFDTSTEGGRSKERLRRILLTSISTIGTRVITAIVGIISVPMTLHYLGAERYGLWMAISSFIAMLTFADLGVGNGLFNAVAEAYGKDDYEVMKRYVSSAFILLASIGMVLMLAMLLVYPWVEWSGFFNVKSPLAVKESGQAILVLVACFALNIPLGICQKVQLGLQQGPLTYLWTALGSVLGLVAILFAIKLKLGLPWLVAAMAGVPTLMSLVNGLLFFGWMMPRISPSLKLASRIDAKMLAQSGLLFFISQISWPVIVASDNMIIAAVLGADSVAKIAVPDKIFSLIPMLVGLALIPLWAAYREALTRGDLAWVRTTYYRSIAFSITVASMLAIMSVILGPRIISAWVGNSVSVDWKLLAGLALWKVLEVWGACGAFLLNGAGKLGLQAWINSLTAAAAISAKLYFVKTMGVAGAPWATCVAFGLFTILPYTLYISRFFRPSRGYA